MPGPMITIEFDDKRVKALLINAPRLMSDVVFDTMARTIAPRYLQHLQTRELSGQSLGVRTGTTRRSAFQRVERAGTTLTGVIGVDANKAPGARILEEGGTIQPRGRALAVPLREAQTGNGVARFAAKDLRDSPARFGYVGSFILNDIIFGVKSGRAVTPLFALKRQVVIKPVGYLTSTNTELQGWAQQTLQQAALKAVGSAK